MESRKVPAIFQAGIKFDRRKILLNNGDKSGQNLSGFVVDLLAVVCIIESMLITAKLQKGALKVRVKSYGYKDRVYVWDSAKNYDDNILCAVRDFCRINYIAGEFVWTQSGGYHIFAKIVAGHTVDIGPHLES